ncbi:MAG: glycosyltransferase [Prevotellaceae bacterium]|jgi:glycosyltransferase involved in cell wall biosynthesis|nr:glycosyltransferase [Prevotellaceae bacterium]
MTYDIRDILQYIDFQDFYSFLFSIILLIAFIVQIFYYLYFYRGVLCRKRKIAKDKKITKNKIIFNNSQPPVSVIICAKDEAENLLEFLPSVLEQNYSDYEVIVVNDGSWDNSEEILFEMSQKYPHLYVTALPNDVSVKSGKKLALTIGIKAAKNDILLFTDADCKPATNNWLSLMVRNMNENTEFVLGFGDYFRKKTLINHLISFDTLFIAMQYLGFAYRGFPYMGVGRNMMYRKSTFFRLRGFAGHLHLPAGDDDLIVNSAANKANTAIECCAESKTFSVPKPNFAHWLTQKRRHLCTAEVYKPKSRRIIGYEVVTRGIFYLFLVLIILQNNLFYIAVAALLFLIRFIIQTVVINKVAKYTGTRKFFISIIFWDIILPLISLYLTTLDKLFFSKNYNKRCRY